MDSTQFIKTVRELGYFKCDNSRNRIGFGYTCVGDPHHNCLYILHTPYTVSTRAVSERYQKRFRGKARHPISK